MGFACRGGFRADGRGDPVAARPEGPGGYVYASDGVLKLTTDRLGIPGTEIYVDLGELFAALD